jgi:type IV pilus assembly protein PilX
MSHRNKKSLPRHGTRQLGVSMVIVLVFTVILTSLGAYALRRAMLGESMSRNSLDAQLAKQAAAAALRDGERDILAQATVVGAACQRVDRPMPPLVGTDFTPSLWNERCPNGQCIKGSGKRLDDTAYSQSNFANSTNVQPWWPSNDPATPPPIWRTTFVGGACGENGGVPYGAYTATPPLPGVVRQPEYIIEAVRTGYILYFRITARGWGASPNSEALAQSIVTLEIK